MSENQQEQGPVEPADDQLTKDLIVRDPLPLTSSEADAIARYKAAVVLAQCNPRNPERAMVAVLEECRDYDLAAKAEYLYSRGGTEIAGPTVWLLKACARHWGNLEHAVIEVARTRDESVVEAYAYDFQANVREVRRFRVPLFRHTKKGSYPLKDPRDIYEHVQNQGSRRVRACLEGIIPRPMVAAARQACNKTMEQIVGDPEKFRESVDRMVGAFAEYRVDQDALERFLGHHLETIKPREVIRLRGVYQSIRDGMSEVGQWFPEPAPDHQTPTPGTEPSPTTPAQ